jgi:hypothetical protein
MLHESPHTTGVLGSVLNLRRMSLRLVPVAGKRGTIKERTSLHLGESEICQSQVTLAAMMRKERECLRASSVPSR